MYTSKKMVGWKDVIASKLRSYRLLQVVAVTAGMDMYPVNKKTATAGTVAAKKPVLLTPVECRTASEWNAMQRRS
ncbi:hypothetical protein IMF27_04945 [Pseudomonas sp. PCH199]|uniref:hypothetical protein n=1 Tax=unclassified Pseudomonas TaxID=196821 RepID=UPI000FFC0642|nr:MULTISPECIES: hypothetical protein [unclassified Pseudomonas]MCW8275129.1 hypothetical protein [Pseudomonas sp. PCH199]